MGVLDAPGLTKADADLTYGRPLRNVFARGAIIDQRSDGVITSQTSRVRCVIRGGATLVRLVYANWYLPSGSSEQPMGNSYDVKASIENPSVAAGRPTGDVTIPVFFNGKRTATVDDGGYVISDPVLINAPADWAIFIRSMATVTAGGRFPLGYATNSSNSVLGDTAGVSEGSVTNTDAVDSGTIAAVSGYAFGPIAVLVEAANDTHTHGAIVLGDSIAKGTGVITPGNGSFLAQELVDLAVPNYRLAVGGESFGWAKTQPHSWRRLSLCRFARHAVVNLGINDINSGNSLATVKADAITYWQMLAGAGLKVHQATILPHPGASSDGYITVAGQTIVDTGKEAIRTALNTWLRSGQAATDSGGALTSVIDAAAQIEVDATGALTLNGGFWKVLNPTPVDSGTATGVTSSTLTDTSKAWTVNALVGLCVYITGATTGAGQLARITSNTATSISINPSFAPTPTGAVTYRIAHSACWDHLHPTEEAHNLIRAGIDLSYLKMS